MPIKSRIDLKKQEAERLHALVVELLREDENKYCADCEAKQPRWASWNLGVFLCIRCAGIHRNLGVHLTKIKSVNLDSWTAEQVQSMRVMGNKRAKQVYEAELPEHFRRPQTDQALESFIRAKYEHKRYILKDWSPPCVNINDLPPPPFDKRQNNLRSSGRKANSPGSIAPQIMPPENVIDSTVSQHNNVANLLDFDNEPVPVAALGKEHNLPDDLFTCSNELWQNSDPSVAGEADGLEDFGPIVSASTTPNLPETHGNSITTSNENEKSEILESAHINDLASLCEPSASEKKSTSDILALFGNMPVRFPAQQNQFIQRYPMTTHSSNIPGNVRTPIPIAQTRPEFSQQIRHFSQAINNCDANSAIFPLSQPAYGFLSGGNVPPVGTGNSFMSQETAAMFAAASPFANSAEVKTSTSNNISGLFIGPLDRPVQKPLSVSNNFVADFTQLNIGVPSSTAVEGSVNGTSAANILWD